MNSAIRTCELRKVYNSLPPAAAGGAPAGAGKQNKGPKPEIKALDGIDLDVAPGQIFGLLGPNGAGKSTTVGILTTRVRPTGGTAWIGEHDVWRDQTAAKRQIGVVAQRPNLDFSLTAREILTLSWSVLRAQFAGAVGARRDAARPVQTDGSRRSTGARIFRRHDAAHVDCARHDARSAGAVPRRAERGARSANAAAAVGDHPRVQPEGSHDFAHHAQHGRGRHVLPAARDHRSRQDHRAGNARRS